MPWERTHRCLVKDLSPGQVWKVWSNVNEWHQWDTDIEYAKIQGEFKEGGIFELKPKAGPRVKIKLLRVRPETTFTDVTTFPLAKMYGIHEMHTVSGGLEIVHTVRIEGPLSFLWRKLVGEKIASGIEEQSQKMIECARQTAFHG